MAEKHVEAEDPFSLNGMVVEMTKEDARKAEEKMTECYIEEYLRIGVAPKDILKMFKDPFYQGMHAVLHSRGEKYVRGLILEFCDGDKEALPHG